MKNKSLVITGVIFGVLILLVGAAWSVKLYRSMEAKKRRAETLRECRLGLKSIFVAEKSYFAEYDKYEEDFRKIGFIPERGNHAVFLVSRTGPLEDRSTPTIASMGPAGIIGVDEYRFPAPTTLQLLGKVSEAEELGMRGTCPACEVTAICVTEYERSSISTASRTMSDGGVVPSGVPSLDQLTF